MSDPSDREIVYFSMPYWKEWKEKRKEVWYLILLLIDEIGIRQFIITYLSKEVGGKWGNREELKGKPLG